MPPRRPSRPRGRRGVQAQAEAAVCGEADGRDRRAEARGTTPRSGSVNPRTHRHEPNCSYRTQLQIMGRHDLSFWYKLFFVGFGFGFSKIGEIIQLYINLRGLRARPLQRGTPPLRASAGDTRRRGVQGGSAPASKRGGAPRLPFPGAQRRAGNRSPGRSCRRCATSSYCEDKLGMRR